MSKDWVKDMQEVQALYCTRHDVAAMDMDTLDKFVRFRLRFIEEELEETWIALTHDSEGVVDGLIDLIVVAVGTLIILDVDIQKAWDEVLRANITKQPGVNPKRENPFGLPDLIKPEGWVPPNHLGNTGIVPRIVEYSKKKRLNILNQRKENK